jgi:hypothetical protein
MLTNFDMLSFKFFFFFHKIDGYSLLQNIPTHSLRFVPLLLTIQGLRFLVFLLKLHSLRNNKNNKLRPKSA